MRYTPKYVGTKTGRLTGRLKNVTSDITLDVFIILTVRVLRFRCHNTNHLLTPLQHSFGMVRRPCNRSTDAITETVGLATRSTLSPRPIGGRGGQPIHPNMYYTMYVCSVSQWCHPPHGKVKKNTSMSLDKRVSTQRCYLCLLISLTSETSVVQGRDAGSRRARCRSSSHGPATRMTLASSLLDGVFRSHPKAYSKQTHQQAYISQLFKAVRCVDRVAKSDFVLTIQLRYPQIVPVWAD